MSKAIVATLVLAAVATSASAGGHGGGGHAVPRGGADGGGASGHFGYSYGHAGSAHSGYGSGHLDHGHGYAYGYGHGHGYHYSYGYGHYPYYGYYGYPYAYGYPAYGYPGFGLGLTFAFGGASASVVYGHPPGDGYTTEAGDPGDVQAEGDPGDEPRPPRAESRPQGGELRLRVQPDDASVYVDGESRGVAYRLGRVMMPPGRHRVEVVRPGFRDAEREIEIRPGETRTVDIELARP